MRNKKEDGRFPEIDVIRGIAVVSMVIYHVLFDLKMLGLLEIRIAAAPIELLADATAATFFLLVGTSLYISFSREKCKGRNSFDLFRKYFLRGIKLIFMGGVITGVTYLLYPEFVIVFGALHFIGFSVVAGYILLEFARRFRRAYRLIFFGLLSVAIVGLAAPVRGIKINHRFLLWLGLTESGFQSLDYFPLVPWFGFVLGGLVLGESFYPEGERKKNLYPVRNRACEFLGRNSLIVYFLHQPLIYLAVFLYGFSAGGIDPSTFGLFN